MLFTHQALSGPVVASLARARVIPMFVVGMLASCQMSAESQSTEGTSEATGATQSTGTSSTGETTTDSSPTTTTTGDETTTDDDPFLIEIDFPWEPECIPYQESCPEGQKCMPYANDGGSSWNATKCVDIMGTGAHGESCTVVESGVSGLDDCALGHMCWNVDPETKTGECVAFCTGPSSEQLICEPEKHYCAFSGDGVLFLCLPNCDPILQDCSNPDDGCYLQYPLLKCAPMAAPDDMGHEGDPCEYINQCQAGLGCIDEHRWPDCPGEEGCCAPYCDLQNPECPTPETECIAIFDSPEPWQEHLGQCMLAN